MKEYEVREAKMFECSCDSKVKYDDREIRIHVALHKRAGDKVLFQSPGGYSYEM
jgi:hypothetical protein